MFHACPLLDGPRFRVDNITRSTIFGLHPIFTTHFNWLAGYTDSHALDDNVNIT
jgi:hypothetical protein